MIHAQNAMVLLKFFKKNSAVRMEPLTLWCAQVIQKAALAKFDGSLIQFSDIFDMG